MSTSALSETVSKKRGRPRAFDLIYIMQLKAIFPEITTPRQMTAKAYEIRAIGAMKEATSGLYDGVEQIFSPNGPCHSTILEQLGRFQLEAGRTADDVLAVARALNRRIAEEKLTARDATAIVRHVRATCNGGGMQ